ncbi:MAG: TonB-dependent receptor, partial [Deltaproteobacteria bacterium]|nr:TonB-dependent receptor [Deltaproteobacteria bacterium]
PAPVEAASPPAPVDDSTADPDAEPDEDLADMSLEELLAVTITTASNMSESQSRAPGVVIRLTREDMEARGYRELLDIFDDLPGMDVVRPWGDNYLKVYWRGYRTDLTQPFLLMIDGMVVNSLWTGDGSVAAAMPISEIDHVEVVYGPASAVYGANAFMGVVNVITLTGAHRAEPVVRFRATTGSFHGDRLDRRILDGVVQQDVGGARLSIAGRLALDWTDAAAADRFEYSRAAYADDPSLWGGYLEFQNLARGASSPVDEYGLDARLTVGNLELGASSYALATGYGLVYATDKVQPYARWEQYEQSAHASYEALVARGITSRSLVRARSSGIGSPSYFLSGFDEGTPAARVLEVSYWQATNRSISASEDVEIERGELVSVLAGARYERKDLQSAYDITTGPHLAPGDVTADVPLPGPPDPGLRAVERPITDDYGIYAQARLRKAHLLGKTDTHALHLGVRYDYNSDYGAAHSPTLRIGYVGEVDSCRGLFLGKLLYGEGFQEPNPRQLYGGWLGSGSSPALRPENSRTLELNLSHTTARFSNLVSAYYVQNYDTITQFAGGASNKGARTVVGVDYHLRALLHPRHLESLSLWAYYSYLWSEETSFDSADREVRAPIGDLASHQVWLGGTATRGRFTATVRGRGMGDRTTVASNPVRSINGAFIVDANLRVDHVGTRALSLALQAQNLLGTPYSHPGIRTADSGETPGGWQGAQWVGSAGYYNSRLPQPGRLIMLTLGLDL